MTDKELRFYQAQAVERFKESSQAFLAFEMRLGKTLTTIRLMRRHKLKPTKIVVVCPITVSLAWEEELLEEQEAFVNLTRMTTADKKRTLGLTPNTRTYFVVNYEAVRLSGVFETDALILDESTIIKNPKAKITKALIKTSHHAKIRICLSGQPNPQSILDLYSQMAFLNCGSWMGANNYWMWRKRVATPLTPYEWFVPNKSRVRIRAAFSAQAAIVSRKDVGLAETMIRQKRIVELLPEQKRQYKHIMKTWEVPGVEMVSTKYSLVVISWLRRLCGGFLPGQELKSQKYAELSNLLSGELAGKKVVIWFAHNQELVRASELVHDPLIITGTTKIKERRKIIARFQSEAAPLRLFIQVKVGQFGIRLDSADTCIYFSRTYSLEENQQSNDRIVNPSKKAPLLTIDILTQGTIEEMILDGIKTKKLSAQYVLGRLGKL